MIKSLVTSDKLFGNEILKSNFYLLSENGQYKAILQDDGDLAVKVKKKFLINSVLNFTIRIIFFLRGATEIYIYSLLAQKKIYHLN